MKKLSKRRAEVIFLYTAGVYFNSEKTAYTVRERSNNKIFNHSRALKNLLEKEGEYTPEIFHYLPYNYVLINSKHYIDFLNKLEGRQENDQEFRNNIQKDMGDREYNKPNVRFILEETVATHIIRQKLVQFPQAIIRNDNWRLMAYPGSYIHADVYQWQNDILPKPDNSNRFAGTYYNFDEKKVHIFSEIDEI